MNPADTLSVELAGFGLERPAWLLALLPLGILVWFLGRARSNADAGWRAVIDPHLLPRLLATGPARDSRVGLLLLALGLIATVLALAGPARPGATDIAWRSDAARVLVVDLSPAMAETDLAPSRVERARLKILDLLRAAPGGQTALVIYADEPYLVAPLTSDAETVALLVPELAPEVMPRAGDRPERALRMAAELLAGSGAGARDLVWITAAARRDAVSQALTALPDEGLRLSILHLPSVQDSASSAQGSASPSASAMRHRAEASGGRYLTLRADDGDVRELAQLFASARDTVAEGRRATQRARELGPWLVLLLLPLAALAFRRGVFLALALPLLLIPPPAQASGIGSLWERADQRAHRLLETGNPAAAAQAFTDPRWRAVAYYRAGRYAEAAAELAPLSDPDSHYNRGNALARLERLEEALDAYQAALRLRPTDPDIRHNHDLVRDLLARREPDPPPQPSQDTDDPSEPPPEPKPDPADGEGQGDTGQGDRSGGEAPNDGQADPTTPRSSERRPEQETGTEPPPIDPVASAPGADPSPAADPPRPSPPAAQAAAAAAQPRGRSDPAREAELLAEQWLRRVPDEPGGLLRRKLMLEHARRQAQEAQR